MALTPTWDLLYITIGVMIVIYSCIIGRNWTAKIILGAYAAILATDAFGLVFEKFLMTDQYINLARGFPDRATFLAAWELSFFAIAIIIFARKVGYYLELSESPSYFIRMWSQIFYGGMLALLITTALLVYTSGASFVVGAMGPGMTIQVANSPLFQGQGTDLVRLVYENARWIFLIPASILLFRIR